MKNANKILAPVLALTLLAGCGGITIPAGPTGSDDPGKERVQVEKVTPNGLVLRLLELEGSKNEGENVILSPLSIQMAMAMAANGASGQAAEDVEKLLGMDTATLNAMLSAYLKREDDTLSIANSMWFNESLDHLVNGDFKDTLKREYHAGEGSFLPGDPASARAINDWVKEKTKGRIDSIVDADSLSRDMLAILINALHFDGRWADPFEKDQVTDGLFTAGTEKQEARFMCQWVSDYYETDYAVGFSKAYEDGYEFVAVLPKEEGGVEPDKLDLDAFLSSRTREYEVSIRIPKFELEYAASLSDTLKALGLEKLFETGGLNGVLTGEAVAGGSEAHISDVIHKTYIRMYEEGTEAAAVTGVMVECTSMAMPRQVKQVWLDRPFAFFIRDTSCGQIVFCGVIHSLEG